MSLQTPPDASTGGILHILCGGSCGSLIRVEYDVSEDAFLIGKPSAVRASAAGSRTPLTPMAMGFALIGKLASALGARGGGDPIVAVSSPYGGVLHSSTTVAAFVAAGGSLSHFLLPLDKPGVQVSCRAV